MKHLRQTIRNIAIMVSMALVIGTVSVSAGVTDNLGSSIDKILGPVNASLSGNFNTSSTNGKLNQMQKDVVETKDSMESLLAPYLSELTVWVDSTNDFYNGKTVSATNSEGKKETASFTFKNGHYEATFSKLVRNTYTIAYPYIASSKILNLTTGVTLNGSAKRQQLFGDLQHMTIADIQACCKAGAITSIAKVGDTFSDGTYTYTIIGINQDTPSDSNGNALNKSQYGDVLTVMPLGAPAGATNGQPVSMNASATPWGVNDAVMNDNGTNSGSWAYSDMRKILLPQYLAKLPRSTQNAIGYVQKVTGTCNENTSGGSNSVTGDKCFLLSSKEIFGGSGGNYLGCTENEANATFQYQYFQSIATTRASRNINSTAEWWLRSPYYNCYNYFCIVLNGMEHTSAARIGCGVFAAFCIY